MTTVDPNYMAGRVKYKRPQAIILSNNPGTLSSTWAVSGKTATVAADINTVTVLNGTSGLYVGQIVEKTDTAGSGQFGSNAVITAVDAQTSTITLDKNNLASGSIVFRAGSTSFVPEGQEFVDFIILSDHGRAPIDINSERIEKRQRMVNGRMRSYHIADKMKLSLSWDNLPSRAYPTAPNINASTGLSSVEPYTVDGGAGGNDLLKWYEDNVGSFWVYLAYDRYHDFGQDSEAYGHMAQYNQVVEMYISDFSHTVNTRGGLFDMWSVSLSLEEA